MTMYLSAQKTNSHVLSLSTEKILLQLQGGSFNPSYLITLQIVISASMWVLDANWGYFLEC